MPEICRQEVIMPGGIELTMEAERHLNLNSDTKLLSVACGTGELECYLAEKYRCPVVGIDITERFIERARKKAVARGLDNLVQFKIGDGNSIEFDKETFDRVFCSGGLCDFFDKGVAEFHRVLKHGGKAAVIDVVWKNEQVPIEVKQCWTGEISKVQTLEEDCRTFESRGFKVLFAWEYDEPSWWEAYYDDRGNAPNWQQERANYRDHKNYIALGLFVIEKT
jgi:ubiquinone/menaquinone biosynthesis C-methylase UbiE